MEAKKDIVFKDYILDNVHGFIGLTAIEDEIERTPIFKRLQDISQLGLVKRIFPGAVHNRYIHSLGVMHIVDQMALCLDAFTPAERQVLRLAGMLHDLGHYPLSHDLEQVYDQEYSVLLTPAPGQDFPKQFAEEAKREIQKIKDSGAGGSKTPKLFMTTKTQYHHETVTARVIEASQIIQKAIRRGVDSGAFDETDEIWSDKSGEEKDKFVQSVKKDICAIIRGNGEHISDYYAEHFSAMLQLMHSELDADRIDYLLRDASFSGASYGTFDLGMLLKNLAMKEIEKDKWIVGVKPKGIGCADQYMVNRYLAYTQVIYHKYTSIIAKMLKTTAQWMIFNREGFFFYPPAQVDDIIKSHESSDSYISFTDNYFFEKLNGIQEKGSGCPEKIYCLVNALRKYRALDMKEEEICAGDMKQQRRYFLKKSGLHSKIAVNNKENQIFIFNRKNLTNHIPIREFEKKLKGHKLNEEQYKLDRLMDGLAVIEEGKEPYLLIDSPQSCLVSMWGMQHSFLREYELGI